MRKILIIGYGNTLRGDDAAGVRAASLIAKRFPDIECITVHQLMPEQAEQIAASDVVFFLDAQVGIKKLSVRSIESGGNLDQPRTHFISPGSLLDLGRRLYRHEPTKAYIVGIPATAFEFSEEFSDTTNRAVNECVEFVGRMITDFSESL